MATKNTSKSTAAKKSPAPAAKAKDLPAKKNAKGGIRGGGLSDSNHNETLVGDVAR